MCKKQCKGDKCALSLIYPSTNANIACDEECYFSYKDQAINNEYIKKHLVEMKECDLI